MESMLNQRFWYKLSPKGIKWFERKEMPEERNAIYYMRHDPSHKNKLIGIGLLDVGDCYEVYGGGALYGGYAIDFKVSDSFYVLMPDYKFQYKSLKLTPTSEEYLEWYNLQDKNAPNMIDELNKFKTSSNILNGYSDEEIASMLAAIGNERLSNISKIVMAGQSD